MDLRRCWWREGPRPTPVQFGAACFPPLGLETDPLASCRRRRCGGRLCTRRWRGRSASRGAQAGVRNPAAHDDIAQDDLDMAHE